ncbi:MAG: hypothetical protein KKC80_02855 [Candidatus Margulisbacteria bacterium]|nr:hypothetical protein [Candidatus Margulisiibacteriota bacterium]MBU1616804.1 hypothetical protein [Candidatus Margulisiibacteriota bacterium]MBU1867667.1 hypothetical protein [Candidatus Margulisiibacteriota bacterium]
MGDKKGYLIAGLLGAVAGAASLLGLAKIMPKMMEKCCDEHKIVRKKGKKAHKKILKTN